MADRISVRNIQRYNIGRGGIVFPPGQDVDVNVRHDRQYREIKACIYLRITHLENAPDVVTPPGDGVLTEDPSTGDTPTGDDVPVVELTAEEALNALGKADLRAMADQAGLELPGRATKPQLVAAILAASDQETISDEDILDAMTLEELRGEASAYEIDVPDDAGKDDLVKLILAAIEALDAPTVVRLDALDEMDDDELRALLDNHGVEVPAEATHEQMIGAIAASDAFAVELTDELEA